MRLAKLLAAAAALAACHATSPPAPVTPPPASARAEATGCPAGFRRVGTVCKSQSGVPAFTHVWLVVEENEGFDDVVRGGRAPYLGQLIDLGALLTNYHAVAHPSLPNYLALVGGDTFGVTRDGEAVEADKQVAAAHPEIGHELAAAGRSWRAYEEGMSSPCSPLSERLSHYAARHNPFPYFLEEQGSALCAQSDVPFDSSTGGFLADLRAGRVPAFSFLTPDVCDDGHDACGGDPVAHVDAWLGKVVPSILASPAFQDGGALFITWDEDDGNDPQNRVPMVVVSPLLRSPGLRSDRRYDHYSFLATVEDGFGLPRLGKAKAAPPINDIWR